MHSEDPAAPRGAVTILHADPGCRTTKTIDRKTDRTLGYRAGKYFRFQRQRFHGWHGSDAMKGAKEILDHLHKSSRELFVLGEPVPEVLAGGRHRRPLCNFKACCSFPICSFRYF